jgi:myo-inositol-1(or 4)-monophosphatase
LRGADHHTLPSHSDDLALLMEAALDAGRLALGFFGNNPRTWHKDQNSPVSEADIAVDELLKDSLMSARPGYGWLSEETADDAARLQHERVFIVDPIDGTRGFIAGSSDWVVSIAVVEHGQAIAGVLVRPVTGDVFAARLGGGATLNGQRIAVSAIDEPILARAAGVQQELPVALPDFAQDIPRIASLALRLAKVASGEIDVAFARANAHDWDIAAADIILHEAGGQLSGFDGARPRYNLPTTRHVALIAASPPLHRAVIKNAKIKQKTGIA